MSAGQARSLQPSGGRATPSLRPPALLHSSANCPEILTKLSSRQNSTRPYPQFFFRAGAGGTSRHRARSYQSRRGQGNERSSTQFDCHLMLLAAEEPGDELADSILTCRAPTTRGCSVRRSASWPRDNVLSPSARGPFCWRLTFGHEPPPPAQLGSVPRDTSHLHCCRQ